MTREEALQHFKEQLDIFGGEHAEAIKVAIEALSEETSTIQEKHQLSEETSTNTPTKSTNISTKSTNISTDASAGRPRGEWIDENHRPKSWQFKCSECGETAYYPQRNHEKYQSGRLCGYNFCPNCGADMRSE